MGYQAVASPSTTTGVRGFGYGWWGLVRRSLGEVFLFFELLYDEGPFLVQRLTRLWWATTQPPSRKDGASSSVGYMKRHLEQLSAMTWPLREPASAGARHRRPSSRASGVQYYAGSAERRAIRASRSVRKASERGPLGLYGAPELL